MLHVAIGCCGYLGRGSDEFGMPRYWVFLLDDDAGYMRFVRQLPDRYTEHIFI